MSTSPARAAAAACPWLADDGLPADLRLEDYPAAMLLRLAQSIQQELSATYARAHGLSAAEWRMLARLHAEGPMLLRDLCLALAMDKAYASRILRTLQPQGYLEVTSDPDHGRRLVVAITPAGRALARKLMPQARASQGRLLQVLDAGERAALYGAVRKLQAAIDAGLPDVKGPRLVAGAGKKKKENKA